MRLKTLFSSMTILVSTCFLSACATVEQTDKKQAAVAKVEPWTLTFFHFNNGKKIHSEEFSYQTRRECFDAMFEKETAAKKVPKRSGAGMCTKWFAEGQVRTEDDVLKYK